jgi:hypothetical protein
MLKSRLGRSFGVFSSLAACALLSACPGGKSGPDGREAPAGGTAANTGTTVVLHLTGMLLVVPSTQAGEVANVLIPSTVPNHKAILAFGMEPGNPDAAKLCMDPQMVQSHGICHVNLMEWTVTRFLAGGEAPPSGLELPSGVLNLTRLSGSQYKVNASAVPQRVTLRAGWAGPNPCSLANWDYQPVGAQTSERAALINVLDWEINNPTDLTIEFRKDADVVPVTLPPAEDGKIEVVLANVHNNDVKDIPPGKPGQIQKGDATHVKHAYGLLKDPQGGSPEEATHRPVPMNPALITNRACSLRVTSTVLRALDEVNAAGTAACMVATGTGG